MWVDLAHIQLICSNYYFKRHWIYGTVADVVQQKKPRLKWFLQEQYENMAIPWHMWHCREYSLIWDLPDVLDNNTNCPRWLFKHLELTEMGKEQNNFQFCSKDG